MVLTALMQVNASDYVHAHASLHPALSLFKYLTVSHKNIHAYI